MRIEIFRAQAERFGESSLLKFDGTECRHCLRHGDALRSAILETNLNGKDAGARFLHHVYAAFLCGNDAQFRKKKPSANDWVAGKFQLFASGEDAQAGEGALVGRLLHEDRFGEIHLAGDGLHLIVGKAVAIGEDRERIAFEAGVGENVESVETVFHWVVSRGRSKVRKSDALELGDSPFVGDVSGVERGFRLNQNDVHFFVRNRAMLDASRNDDEFTFMNYGFVIAELHAQRAFDDEKKLIFIVVVMPDKFTC